MWRQKTFALNAKVILLLKWNEIEIRLFKKISPSFVQATGDDEAVDRLRDYKGWPMTPGAVVRSWRSYTAGPVGKVFSLRQWYTQKLQY